MEKAGFIQVMDNLIAQGVKITAVSTDRHNQIRKLMKNEPRYANITHTVDPWHVIKGLKKKLNAKSKKKGCEAIGKFESVSKLGSKYDLYNYTF